MQLLSIVIAKILFFEATFIAAFKWISILVRCILLLDAVISLFLRLLY